MESGHLICIGTMYPREDAIPNNVLQNNKVVTKGRNRGEVGSNDFICNRSVDIGVLEPNSFIFKHFAIIYDSEYNYGNKKIQTNFLETSLRLIQQEIDFSVWNMEFSL